MSQKRSVFAGSTRAVHGAETTNSRRITTSAPKSARPRSSSRTGSLCRKHSGFPRSRGDESPGSAASDDLPSRKGEPLRSSTALRPRQVAIPATATSCSLYRPTSRPSCRLYSLSLSDRDPLRSSRHASSFYISRLSLIFVQLLTPHAQKKGRFARLPSYVCKGRFRRPFPCFRPWTVFFTTSTPTKPRILRYAPRRVDTGENRPITRSPPVCRSRTVPPRRRRRRRSPDPAPLRSSS